MNLLFDDITKSRDRAIFTVILRCGLRVEEVANLTFDAIDLKHKKIYFHNGRGGKDGVVYTSKDAHDTLVVYLR